MGRGPNKDFLAKAARVRYKAVIIRDDLEEGEIIRQGRGILTALLPLVRNAANSVQTADSNPELPDQESDDDDAAVEPENTRTASEHNSGSIYRNPDVCPVIHVSEDKSELHILLPETVSGGTNSHRSRKFFFVGLRQVQFADGTKTVGWCSNSACSSHSSHKNCIYEGVHYSGRSLKMADSTPALCEWSSKLLAAWGGSDVIQQIMQSARPTGELGNRVVELHTPGMKAVRAGSRFSDWAVVLRHLNGSGWFCTQCDRVHSCTHLTAAGLHLQLKPNVTLDKEAFEKMLKLDFDITSGSRKLKCISALPLPEDLSSNPALLKLYDDRSKGIAGVPSICRIADERLCSPCAQCGTLSWGAPTFHDSLVFLPAAAVETAFEMRECQQEGCKGCITVDGQEFGLLRKTLKLAFSLELMYQWADRLRIGSPDTWSTSWTTTILKMKNLSSQQAAQYNVKFKAAFREATMDFVQLLAIDYDAGFRCNCWQEGITMDGMAMCFHQDQARIVHSWLPESNGSLAYGSLSSARIIVRDKRMRDSLLAFCNTGQGLTDAELQALRAAISSLPSTRPEKHLLPFLLSNASPSGQHTVLRCNAPLLGCIATTAPACQYMRPGIFDLVDKLIQVCS